MTTSHHMKRAVAVPPVQPTKPKPKPTTVAPKPKPTVAPPVFIPPVKPPIATTTPPPATTTTESVTPTTTIDPGNSTGTEPTTSSGPNTGLIVGIVAGVAVLLALIAGLVVRNRRRKQRGEEVYKAELYQQQRMMNDNSSSVLAGGARRFGGATGTGSRGGVGLGLGKRGMSGETGDRESLSEDYRQQQEAYYQQQPEWFAKKSPLEYYRQVPPIEELLRSVGRKESDNSLGGGYHAIGGPGDKDEIIELQHTGSLSSSSSSATPGQGVTEIVAARSMQASTMQQNLQQHQQQLQQQRQQQLQQIQQEHRLQQQQRKQQQQEQEQQLHVQESIPLNSTQHIANSTSTANNGYPTRLNNNEPGLVFPSRHQQLSQQLEQEREKQLQQHQQQEDQHNTRGDHTPPHSGHLPPIQPHSPMSSVYHEPQRSPTATATTTRTSSVFLHAPMATSRPDSFYNASNILNAAGENSMAEKGEDYMDIDMSAYYRPPPPAVPATPSGFYDFDLGALDSGNNNNSNINNTSSTNTNNFTSNNRSNAPPPTSFANSQSSTPTGLGTGAELRGPIAGVASPPPIPRATRPVSIVPPRSNSNNSTNNSGAQPPIPVSTYTPPPLPAISTTNGAPSYSTGGSASVTSPTPLSPISPTSPGNGPLMGGRTPRSIHGSVGRRM